MTQESATPNQDILNSLLSSAFKAHGITPDMTFKLVLSPRFDIEVTPSPSAESLHRLRENTAARLLAEAGPDLLRLITKGIP